MESKEIEVDHVVCKARSGAHVMSAIKEALILALTEDRMVVMVHNDRRYGVDPKQLIQYVYGELRDNVPPTDS